MRTNKLPALDNYFISLVIHVLVLLILALISSKQAPRINELIIDWVTQESQEIIQEDFAPAGSTQLRSSKTTQTKVTQAIEENPIVQGIAEESKVARSIEPPVVRANANINRAPAEGTGSTYLSGVISNLSSGTSGNNGFLLEDDEGNITVIKSVIPDPPISDYGRVKLQFKIKQDGSVDSQSIIPVIIDDPIYTQESIKALRQWRFSVKSNIRDKAYRITFIFKPE